MVIKGTHSAIIFLFLCLIFSSCTNNKCIVSNDYKERTIQINSLALARVETAKGFKKKDIKVFSQKAEQTFISAYGIASFLRVKISKNSLKDTLLNWRRGFECCLPKREGLTFGGSKPDIILFILELSIVVNKGRGIFGEKSLQQPTTITGSVPLNGEVKPFVNMNKNSGPPGYNPPNIPPPLPMRNPPTILYSARYVFWDNNKGKVICFGEAGGDSFYDEDDFIVFDQFGDAAEKLCWKIVEKSPFKKRMKNFDSEFF